MDLAFAVYFEYRRRPQLVSSLLYETAIVVAAKKKDEDIDRDRQNYDIRLTDKRRRLETARCARARALLPRSSLSIVAEWFGENDVRTIVVEISINDAIREISLAGAIELVRCGVSKQVLPRIPTPLAVWKISPCRRGK